MIQTAAIRYREFWDVPRIFLLSFQERLFLFDCPFDEELEDYPNQYKVYLLPNLSEEELDGSWEKLSDRALRHLGDVPIVNIQFDPNKLVGWETGCWAINPAILETIPGAICPAVAGIAK
jgi:hypothetical protein